MLFVVETLFDMQPWSHIYNGNSHSRDYFATVTKESSAKKGTKLSWREYGRDLRFFLWTPGGGVLFRSCGNWLVLYYTQEGVQTRHNLSPLQSRVARRRYKGCHLGRWLTRKNAILSPGFRNLLLVSTEILCLAASVEQCGDLPRSVLGATGQIELLLDAQIKKNSKRMPTISNVTRSHKERHHSATWLVRKNKFEGVFFSRLSLTIGNVYFSFSRHTWVIVSCAETATQFQMSHLYSFILCSHFGWLPYNAVPCQIACSVHLCPPICVAVHLHMLIIHPWSLWISCYLY